MMIVSLENNMSLPPQKRRMRNHKNSLSNSSRSSAIAERSLLSIASTTRGSLLSLTRVYTRIDLSNFIESDEEVMWIILNKITNFLDLNSILSLSLTCKRYYSKFKTPAEIPKVTSVNDLSLNVPDSPMAMKQVKPITMEEVFGSDSPLNGTLKRMIAYLAFSSLEELGHPLMEPPFESIHSLACRDAEDLYQSFKGVKEVRYFIPRDSILEHSYYCFEKALLNRIEAAVLESLPLKYIAEREYPNQGWKKGLINCLTVRDLPLEVRLRYLANLEFREDNNKAVYFLPSLSPDVLKLLLPFVQKVEKLNHCLLVCCHLNSQRKGMPWRPNDTAKFMKYLNLEDVPPAFTSKQLLPSKNSCIQKTVADFSSQDELDIVVAAHRAGAYVSAKDSSEKTALHLSSNSDVQEYLLENGASPNEVDDKENTPLHSSVDFGIQNVALLLQYKAHVNVQNDRGNTPLHIAAVLTHKDITYTDVISILIAHKANIMLKNCNDETVKSIILRKKEHLDRLKKDQLQVRQVKRESTIKAKKLLEVLKKLDEVAVKKPKSPKKGKGCFGFSCGSDVEAI